MSKTSVAHDIQGGSRTGDVLINENVDFSGLLLSDSILNGLRTAGFQRPSPIQLKAIPLGRCGLDLIVQAKSGTGKTCVFSVIALEGLQTESYALQVLVLAPTREIAIQIWDVISSIGQCIPTLKCYTFIGGMPVTEDKQKLKKCHIAVGTPGRIKQLIECGIMSTDSIRMFVLDEADKLLEESFQEQINWIYSTLPENKQMLALSATYPEYLAQHLTSYMRNPTFLRLNISDPALLGIKQFRRVVTYHALPNKVFDNKTEVVIELLSSVNFQQCLIFSNLQTRAQNMADALISHGWPTACIAGSHDQKDRNEAMSQLKTYKCRVLISTDLTSRGIDADKVNMVINLDVPKDHETYLHRIGRAGRFGTFGAAVTIVSQGQEENELNKVEKKCNTHIRDLPDPIPCTLAKSEGTINLDDMVSTEQIITDRTRLSPRKTRLSPRKTEVTRQHYISKKGDAKPWFNSKNDAERERLKNPVSQVENKGRHDVEKTASVSGNSDSEVRTESAEESQDLSLDNVLIGRNLESANERGDCHTDSAKSNSDHLPERMSEKGDSPKTALEDSTKMKAKVETLTENEDGKERCKTRQKRNGGSQCGFQMIAPQLGDVLCHDTRKNRKSYEEKESEYKKYLEERDMSLEKREAQVKPNPYVWKDGQKEQLLSMIEKILTIDEDGKNLETEDKIKRKDTATTGSQTKGINYTATTGSQTKGINHTATTGSQTKGINYTTTSGSQTKGINYPTNVKDKIIMNTTGKSKGLKTCESQNMDNFDGDVHEKSPVLSVPPSKSVISQTEKKFKHSEYPSIMDDYEEKHENDELFTDNEECLEEECLADEKNSLDLEFGSETSVVHIEEERDYDHEWFEESEDVYDKEPQFCQSDYPDQYNSGNPYHWPPVYSPYCYNPYYYTSNALQPRTRMTHEQKKFMFNYHLASAHYQQHSYISAMLSKFY